ncbi:MAG TPA: glycosyltransferase [Ktedonobacterales bacterium]|jgi:MGT family glycosyltransferase
MEHAIRQPVHYLFALWDGGGNIPPQLALARRLSERGHHVRILAPRTLQSRIEAAGCQFVPLHEAPEHDSSSRTEDLLRDWEARTPLTAAGLVRDRLIFGTASGYASDVTAAIADSRPDVVVTDYLLLGSYVAAERAGIPLAALVHTVYPLPAPGMPPYGMGFQPAKGAPGRVRDALFAPVFRRFYNARLKNLNAVRAAMGLRPLASVFEQFARANRLLVLTSQAFDFPADALPANVRYVGPHLDDPAWLAPWEPAPSGDDNLPFVLVSLSTTFQQQADVVRRVVAALAELPVRGLVTLGPALDIQQFSLPPNVRAEPYAPHVLVCPHADLVITHGGHGTVITALSFGVPLLCLPMGRDQADNAARVVWCGAGVRRSSKADTKTLRRAIQQVLGEPRFRESARRIASGIARDGGPAQAIAELEGLSSPLALASE